MPTQIVHLTSAHPRFDVRIFLKECVSLSRAGYSVSLVVADGKGDEYIKNISIYDVGLPDGRLNRIINTSRNVFEKARQLDADIYHIHDPELMPAGIKLKKLSKKVIFDSHEDVPVQMLHKPYLIKPVRWMISRVIRFYERWACRQFDAVVTATPFIRKKFLSINPESVNVNNYPIPDELSKEATDWSCKKNQVCYVGGISVDRGIKEMVAAMSGQQNDVRLRLAGVFSEIGLVKEVEKISGWEKVDELGFLDRESVSEVINNAVAGLVVLHPIANYVDALPIKMFEYMVVGIPVIASNFPLWRDIIEGNDCGVCVDPLDPQEINVAINEILSNPERAEKMGQNGRRAVLELYNWNIEEYKLLDLYKRLQ